MKQLTRPSTGMVAELRRRDEGMKRGSRCEMLLMQREFKEKRNENINE